MSNTSLTNAIPQELAAVEGTPPNTLENDSVESTPRRRRWQQFSLRALLVATTLVAVLAAPFVRRKRTFDRIDLAETPLSTIEFHEPDHFAGIWNQAAAWCGPEWIHEIQGVVAMPFAIDQSRLNAIGQCANLEHLSFGIGNKHVDLSFLGDLDQLKELNIHINGYNQDGRARTGGANLTDVLPKLTSLQSLRVSADSPGKHLVPYYLTAEGFAPIADQLLRLETICIEAPITGELIMLFDRCPNLQNLVIYSEAASAESARVLLNRPDLATLVIEPHSAGIEPNEFAYASLSDGHAIASYSDRQCILLSKSKPDLDSQQIQAWLTNRPESSRSVFLSGKWFNLDSLRDTTISIPHRVMAYLRNQSCSTAEPDLVLDDIAVFWPAVKATPTMTSSTK